MIEEVGVIKEKIIGSNSTIKAGETKAFMEDISRKMVAASFKDLLEDPMQYEVHAGQEHKLQVNSKSKRSWKHQARMRRSPIHPNEGDTSEVGGRAGKRGVREIAEVGRPVTKRLKGSDTLSFGFN
ncbi:hypothetical protein GBA52_016287 [Prunus armeniaca]|nr:hypothetical protein GBA52_016287 [Prunus armeniaca]